MRLNLNIANKVTASHSMVNRCVFITLLSLADEISLFDLESVINLGRYIMFRLSKKPCGDSRINWMLKSQTSYACELLEYVCCEGVLCISMIYDLSSQIHLLRKFKSDISS